jgi:hypothetical protein
MESFYELTESQQQYCALYAMNIWGFNDNGDEVAEVFLANFCKNECKKFDEVADKIIKQFNASSPDEAKKRQFQFDLKNAACGFLFQLGNIREIYLELREKRASTPYQDHEYVNQVETDEPEWQSFKERGFSKHRKRLQSRKKVAERKKNFSRQDTRSHSRNINSAAKKEPKIPATF